MRIENILIKSVGLFDKTQIELDDVFSIVEGANASGKSTVLNSILFLCHMPVKSIKQLKNITKESEFMSVKGSILFEKESVPMIIEAVGSRVNGFMKKKYFLNGVETYRTRINPFPSCVIFNPEMVSLFTSSLSDQRKFWVRYIEMLDPFFTAGWHRYLAIVRNRNNLLKKIKEGRSRESYLKVWNEKLLESATFVHEQITYWLEQIAKHIKLIATNIDIELDMISITDFESHLENNVQADVNKGYTSVGQHFFKVKLLLDKRDIALYGSRGQSKLVCVRIIVALSNLLYDLFSEYPILLIDDMGAELDNDNIQIIKKLLDNPLQQKIITTIDSSKLPIDVKGKIIKLN